MLKNKVAVVTGGSRGIGRAIALEFARQGASLALLYAGNEEAARKTAEEIAALGVRCEAYRCDVSSSEETKRTAGEILQAFGAVDILVNNAGITKDGLVLSMTEENFERVIDTNLKGAFLMIRQFYTHMMRRRTGRIINISSVAGLMGNAGQANYASAKAGLIGLTKSVAKELAARGVTCNAIAPGFIETDMTRDLSGQDNGLLAAIPLGRMGQPQEVAEAVAFLATAPYITGEVLRVDGGIAM